MSTEYEFSLSKTGDNNAITGVMGDARKIVQLVLQQSTFYNGAGVSIPSYSHLQATPENIAQLRADVDKTIRSGLPDVQLNDVQVSEYQPNLFLVGISIGTGQDEYTFGVSFNPKESGKVVYSVIY